ncbi:MAG: hypothetical protein CMK83_02950 [Pseudomonadales bacterium]|jgi:nickel-type superoxide dismutase maturation protease|uniref:S26 family signal peptidase n=1 Tax=unclassified Ketobacter TaxID=2639109 RepID=UPI000C67483C|nr:MULTISPECIES: S26 family signal peptidase [unclassified Ketobacter]MAA59900.1 hypothetical protein [Pseudomonadales bacterium]MEC8812777.1 S26 family signal peptidase [Pseudomonadota bacterium]HAG96927.1 hypothetical protein [Gammaproteobacteria bacterium]MAQ23155.1 hypothetical protein [Pseudomonadales bacterium]MBI27796.1 hypothetical protein [Pseudomonadales bacterium]|tara:strand:+ start:57669 stop:58346 length:678 start_codon:yes stop_codon:yes gene_type:complete
MKIFTSALRILLCSVFPGGTLLSTRYSVWAFSIPLFGLLIVILFSLTRWVTTPLGFISMLGFLIALHLLTYGLGLGIKSKSRPARIIVLLVIGLIALNGSIVTTSHIYKETWFGFGFYHIPSVSMSPTLMPGDVVLVDSWAFNAHPAKKGDVVVTRKEPQGVILVKRVTRVKEDGQTRWIYIEGDNPARSQDSRQFGWIDSALIIGQVDFVWFSFRNGERALQSL